MTNKLLSIAALAVIMSSNSFAFDATQGEGILMKETGATTAVVGAYLNTNAAVPAGAIITGAPGQLGDALIYPAFFSGNNFETEFSVINTSSTEAMVAKVVLYSAKDSRELRDFNIYLSANDVFRATIKNGKVTSTDGSTVVVGSDNLSVSPDHGYNYTDSSTMASASTPFETSINEDIGYIAVYGMVQANNGGATDVDTHAKYHKKHNELWRDYRHLLDQCRSQNWRDGLQNGIYTGGNVNQPNIDLATAIILTPQVIAPTTGLCNTIAHTTQDSTTTLREVEFKSPTAVLTGTLTVKGNDAKGTRAITIKAKPLLNYTDTTKSILWTEGELASIADRCIEYTAAGASKANYNETCINTDASAFNIVSTLYEFGALEGKLLVTQPWKRTIIQIFGDGSLPMSTAAAWSGTSRQTTANGIASGTDAKDYNVANYGGFKMGRTVYNDDEDKYIANSGGFTVSPASTASAGTIDNEMSYFDPLPEGAQYPRGYAQLTYLGNLHGIVTQMTANEIDGTAEINWLYPFTN